METLWSIFSKLADEAADPVHWPAWVMTATLAVIGQIMATRVFTRERAYRKWGDDKRAKAVHLFWYWMRETQPFHPFFAALFLAAVWPDPENRNFRPVETAGYWIGCATASLFAWVIVKGIAKERGIELTLPGDSVRPAPVKDGPTPIP